MFTLVFCIVIVCGLIACLDLDVLLFVCVLLDWLLVDERFVVYYALLIGVIDSWSLFLVVLYVYLCVVTVWLVSI